MGGGGRSHCWYGQGSTWNTLGAVSLSDNKTWMSRLDQSVLKTIASSLASLPEERISAFMSGAGQKAVVDACRESGRVLYRSLRARRWRFIRDSRRMRKRFELRLGKVWGRPLGLLEAFIQVSLEAGEAFHDQFVEAAIKEQDHGFEALTRLHCRACGVACEILTLLRCGYAAAAHARWRTLHEIAVVAAVIRKHGRDCAERYLLHQVVQANSAIKEQMKHAAKLGIEPPPRDEADRIQKQCEVLKDEYGREFKSNYGWASQALGIKKPGFGDLEAAAELGHLHPYYQMANHAVHADPRGIYFNLGSPYSGVLAGASNMGLAEPGHSAAISLLQVTSALLTSRTTFSGNMILNVMLEAEQDIGRELLEVHRKVAHRAGALRAASSRQDPRARV